MLATAKNGGRLELSGESTQQYQYAASKLVRTAIITKKKYALSWFLFFVIPLPGSSQDFLGGVSLISPADEDFRGEKM